MQNLSFQIFVAQDSCFLPFSMCSDGDYTQGLLAASHSPLLLPPSPTSGQPEAAGRVFSHVLFQSDVSLLLMLSLFLTSTFLSFVALPFLSLFPGFVWWHPSLMSSRALLLLVIYTLQEAQANCENKAVHGAVTGTSVHCSNVASFHLNPKELFGSMTIRGTRMASPQREEHWNL